MAGLFTRVGRIVVVVGFCMALLAPAAVANTSLTASAPGEIAVVTINAHQRTMDQARLNALADGLTMRMKGTAPDIILIQEIVSEPLAYLRDALNSRVGRTARYEVVGRVYSETVNIKVKALLNTKTMKFNGYKLWSDACADARMYQIIQATEIATGKPVAAAGVHIAPMSNPAGTDECKIKNANRTREVMAPYDDTGSIVGDFNRRAMADEYECDPNEDLSAPLQWYTDVTAVKGNGYWYQDTVRKHHWALGADTLKDQWTFEFPTAEALCNGTNGHRRMRMDYVFTSSTMGVVEAHADKGWGGATPGVTGCSDPGCKYSDHRFVWARLTLPGTPPPVNTPPSASFTHSCPDLTCTFTDGSVDSDGTITSRSWNFGDGSTSTAQHPSHPYAAAGEYTVTLTVTDDDGATVTTSQQVSVTASGTGGITLSANGYTAKGKKKVDLNWSVTAATSVDVYRDGAKVTMTPNDGAYTDTIPTKGGGTFTYKVCEVGGTTCSNEVSVTF